MRLSRLVRSGLRRWVNFIFGTQLRYAITLVAMPLLCHFRYIGQVCFVVRSIKEIEAALKFSSHLFYASVLTFCSWSSSAEQCLNQFHGCSKWTERDCDVATLPSEYMLNKAHCIVRCGDRNAHAAFCTDVATTIYHVHDTLQCRVAIINVTTEERLVKRWTKNGSDSCKSALHGMLSDKTPTDLALDHNRGIPVLNSVVDSHLSYMSTGCGVCSSGLCGLPSTLNGKFASFCSTHCGRNNYLAAGGSRSHANIALFLGSPALQFSQ